MPQSGAGDGRRTKERRRQLFEREVERLAGRLYGTALRLTRDADDAEDVVAEAVGRAWARLDELRDPQHFEGWLFQILNNTFISSWRRRRCRQDLETELDLSEPETADHGEFSLYQQLHQPFLLWWGTPETHVIEGLLREDIDKAIDSLPDAFRIVVVLVEIQGYTYREVGEFLDLPLGTVRSRLSRARSLLQSALCDRARESGLVHRVSNHGDGKKGGER